MIPASNSCRSERLEVLIMKGFSQIGFHVALNYGTFSLIKVSVDYFEDIEVDSSQKISCLFLELTF